MTELDTIGSIYIYVLQRTEAIILNNFVVCKSILHGCEKYLTSTAGMYK